MPSGTFWLKWRRMLLSRWFVAQYYLRIFALALRFQIQGVTGVSLYRSARVGWRRCCSLLASSLLILVGSAVGQVQRWSGSPNWQARSQARQQRLEVSQSDQERRRLAWSRLQTYHLPSALALGADTSVRSEERLSNRPQAQPLWRRSSVHPTSALPLWAMLICVCLLLAVFVVEGLASDNLPGAISVTTLPQWLTSTFHPDAHQYIDASKNLQRISQLDPAEYDSTSDYNLWAYSACSTASLTEVLDAYGRHYRIADVLKVEAGLGEITPAQGLMENAGIAKTAAQFGFQTVWGNDWTLDQVKGYANAGHPVIVGWPPSRYEGGHIVVVTGGGAGYVSLADSSLYNRQSLSDAQFMQWWAGFAAVITPE